MKITSCAVFDQPLELNREKSALVQGSIPRLAIKQVDFVNDVNFNGTRENHSLRFTYDEEIGRSVAHLVDNISGETVKVLPSDSQLDHMIRIKRLMGLNLDLKA